jgi:hypothetical protein
VIADQLKRDSPSTLTRSKLQVGGGRLGFLRAAAQRSLEQQKANGELLEEEPNNIPQAKYSFILLDAEESDAAIRPAKLPFSLLAWQVVPERLADSGPLQALVMPRACD